MLRKRGTAPIFAPIIVKMVLTSEEAGKAVLKRVHRQIRSNRLPVKDFMLDSHSFRQMMGCFATGIAVATTSATDGAGVGLTVNSLTSVSLDPPLVLFCIDKKAQLYPVFKAATVFAFNFLGDGQEHISRHFADHHHHPKPKNMWERPQEGCPILRQTLGWVVCRKTAMYKGGDHDIILGEAVKLHKRSGHRDPLLYFHGRYRGIKA